ncbi:hypothetical protein BLL52_2664 [Rhodoferax antarcticus ANT.BR]|uniref:Uncharacterized protein n=1 Tax=Rhodoferax antarcticus ANT.BR TaxID=1111071 RepID=A0A1Q8YEG7_9BURK|nr:hypothetical protein BLL52_2664 [Rhodoferax antarcticus ANT.BR]
MIVIFQRVTPGLSTSRCQLRVTDIDVMQSEIDTARISCCFYLTVDFLNGKFLVYHSK